MCCCNFSYQNHVWLGIEQIADRDICDKYTRYIDTKLCFKCSPPISNQDVSAQRICATCASNRVSFGTQHRKDDFISKINGSCWRCHLIIISEIQKLIKLLRNIVFCQFFCAWLNQTKRGEITRCTTHQILTICFFYRKIKSFVSKLKILVVFNLKFRQACKKW